MPAGASPSSRDTGSQPALRRQNTQRVLQTLARRGPTTQASLARITGLSTGTISNIVRRLDEQNRITSRPIVARGRRAMEISLRTENRLVLGLAFGPRQVRLLVSRVDHQVVAEAAYPLPERHTPLLALTEARRRLDALLAEHDLPATDLAGCGIAVPGNLRAGPLESGSAIHPGWTRQDLTEAARATMPVPCSFDTEANLGALAECSWGPFAAVRELAYLTVGDTIGAGLILGGSVHRGAQGLAGEIGHLQIDPTGEHCSCGNRGCLQTVASLAHITHALRRSRGPHTELNAAGVIALARARDLPTLRVLEDVGVALGAGLAALCNLVNPEVVVLGGPLAGIGAPLLDPVARSLARHALPEIAAGTRLAMSQLGDAELRGAVSLAAQQFVHA